VARLSLRGLTKRYGQVEAVTDVSLDVADGELLVLLGPSGSGKSTILKLVAGLEVADSGEIWLGDERVDLLLPRSRDVAMVFQSYALYPHLSVFANLAFPLRSTGVGREEVRRRVGEVSELLELDGLLQRRPGQLSGGQQQRVALGRAIVRRPRLFLLDEPLSNLDAKLRAQTRTELSALHRRISATTVYVTHDQVEALTMGDRVAVIDAGVLRQVDEPEVLYEYPADVVVAGFLGSPPMNLVPVECASDGATLCLTAGALRVAIPRAAVSADPPRQAVLGIRPEHVCIIADGNSRDATAAGTVDQVELLGSDRIVWVSAAPTRLAVRVPARTRPRPGERLTLGIDPSGVRLFDAATGRRI
jgi:ABC-type sugar transport system ATPase subunit